MNRREFLRLPRSVTGNILNLRCEQLYMKWVDADMHGQQAVLLRQMRAEIGQARLVRLHEATWLATTDFGQHVDLLLEEFRARGGVVEVC